MDVPVSSSHETVAWSLGCHNANLQVFNRRSYSVLHYERHWELKLFIPSFKPSAKCFPQFAGSAQGFVFVYFRGYQEMDHAASELGKGKRRTDHHVPWQITSIIVLAKWRSINSLLIIIEDLIYRLFFIDSFILICFTAFILIIFSFINIPLADCEYQWKNILAFTALSISYS